MDKGIRRERGDIEEAERQIQLLTQENLLMKKRL
jgi:hypothetical protein